MNSDEPHAGREEVHRGHDLETGLLARVREWTDVFPWLRLGRTLRVAGSPPLVLFTAAVFTVWWIGQTMILGKGDLAGAYVVVAWEGNAIGRLPLDSFLAITSHLSHCTPTSVFRLDPETRWARGLLGIVWSLLLWAPTAMLLARQGALLTAGRAMIGLRPAIRLTAGRALAAWLAGLVPLVCTMAIGLLILLVGWVSRAADGVAPVEMLAAVAAAAVAIPCGILVFGAHVAVPLSWAALANEADPDALDSLSRGYEYLFRRPLRVVLYAALSLGILWVVALLAWGVATAADSVASQFLAWTGCSPEVVEQTQRILHFFPTVVVLALLWSLLGGVYLLLRYDAGGQQVEDLWQPPPPQPPSLPELPKS